MIALEDDDERQIWNAVYAGVMAKHIVDLSDRKACEDVTRFANDSADYSVGQFRKIREEWLRMQAKPGP